MNSTNSQYPLSLLSASIENAPEISDADGLVQALSQLCVVAKMARSNPDLRALIEKKSTSIFDNAGAVSLPEIMKAAKTLPDDEPQQYDTQGPNTLIDELAPVWNSFRYDDQWRSSFIGMLNESEPDDPDEWGVSMQWVQLLVSIVVTKSRTGLGIPLDVYKVMAKAITPRGSLGLVGDCSAIGFITIDNHDTSLDIQVFSESTYRLIERLFFLSEREGNVSLVSLFDGVANNSCTGYLSVPIWNSKGYYGDIEYPGYVSNPNRLHTESIEVARLISEKKPAFVMVPSGFLHQNSTCDIRRWLVDSRALTQVIEFPGRTLNGTSVSFAILELYGKGYVDSNVLMTDAQAYLIPDRKSRYALKSHVELYVSMTSEKNHESLKSHECLVTPDELKETDYLLTPKRYIGYEKSALDKLIGDADCESLGELARIIRPTPITLSKSEEGADGVGMAMIEVRISDIDDDGVIRSGSSSRYLPTHLAERIAKFRLQPNDILVGTKGTVGKAGITAPTIDDNLICGQTMVIIRLSPEDSVRYPEYLYRYLATPQVSAFLKAQAGGSTIQFIKAQDLAALPVPLHSLKRQRDIADKHQTIMNMKKQARELDDEAKYLSDTAFDDTVYALLK